MALTLLTGTDAIECAGAADFQSKWKSLHAVCPWSTAYQHPDFVVPWYELYQSVFLPIIVFEENAAGFLVGLLTLALHRHGTTISGAGDHQAEYQGWLQMATGRHFVIAAMRQLRSLFPDSDIFLKYLPPGIPQQCDELAAHCPGLVSRRAYRRPLMKTELAAMERQRRKKNHRQNFNRLARTGDVEFKTMCGHDGFAELFDAICGQYDFRQAALYREMPFSTDPFKKAFYLELHKRGILHATVLTVDQQVAAAHIGLLSGQHALHLGITTYDPARAVHSPGNLLLAMLGLQLATENIAWLDLTPGGDGYKEHFASEHDVVSELRIYRSRRRRWQCDMRLRAKELVKERLLSSGYRPADLVARIERLKSLSLSSLRALPAALRRRYRSRFATLRYCANPDAIGASQLSIAKNSWRDALRFDARGSSTAYCDFLSAAMRKMERSDHLYTYLQGARLAICCWARPGCASQTAASSPRKPFTGDDAVVLFDLYVHADADQQAMVREFFQAIVADVAKAWPGTAVDFHGRVDAEHHAALVACGFVDTADARSTARRRSEMPVMQPNLTEEKET